MLSCRSICACICHSLHAVIVALPAYRERIGPYHLSQCDSLLAVEVATAWPEHWRAAVSRSLDRRRSSYKLQLPHRPRVTAARRCLHGRLSQREDARGSWKCHTLVLSACWRANCLACCALLPAPCQLNNASHLVTEHIYHLLLYFGVKWVQMNRCTWQLNTRICNWYYTSNWNLTDMLISMRARPEMAQRDH